MTSTVTVNMGIPKIRGDYRLKCGRCGSGFSGDDLARIFQRGARHWNKEHGDELENTYEPIDEVEYGGHHLHGNSYEVRKYTVFLTSFDMMDRLGAEDGWLVAQDVTGVCPECHRHIPNEADRITDDPNDFFSDDWACRACLQDAEIRRRRAENRDIMEWIV